LQDWQALEQKQEQQRPPDPLVISGDLAPRPVNSSRKSLFQKPQVK